MPKILTRKMPLSGSAPATLNEEARTVEAVMSTEQPVKVWDWDHGVVDEVLLMKGATYPEQVPLLNDHDRWGVEKVLGSVSGIRTEEECMIGTVGFSKVQDAQDAFTKVAEGHLTDFSIGYIVTKSVFVPEGEAQTIEGKTFEGPVKVSTEWEVKELSITPMGADDQAKARHFMEARNMPKPTENTPTKPEIIEQERTRTSEILGLGQEFDCITEAQDAIRSGVSVADFQKQVLHNVSEARKAPGFRVEMGDTDQEKFRHAAEDALLFRSGISEDAKESEDLASYNLRDMARECLRRSGIRPKGSPLEMIGRAMTSSDFPLILGNTANKSLLAGYDGEENTWKTWCGTGNASDFKTLSIVRPSEMADLDEIPEDDEYKYGSRDEAREQTQLATFGKLFKISRQAIINDDLGALTDIPRAHGEAASRKVSDVAYAVLTANSNMSDGVALFHATHKNLADPAGSPSITGLARAVAAMKVQKDIAGIRVLNIRPRFFIAPVALEGTCEQLFRSTLEGTQAKPSQINPYAGKYFTRVYDPRLDLDSVKAWYLAGPKGKTVTLFFLNGNQKPFMETKNGWNVDGVEYKVRIDVAGKAVDYRALQKNAGE